MNKKLLQNLKKRLAKVGKRLEYRKRDLALAQAKRRFMAGRSAA